MPESVPDISEFDALSRESGRSSSTEHLHSKPLLTIDQQIAHMKAKGITFNLVAEADAARYLCEKCQFFRVYAYRISFAKHEGGRCDGQYVNLDFGQLKMLSNLDRLLWIRCYS